MTDMLRNYYGYWFVLILLVIGLWGMLIKRNLMKKLIAMTLFQAAIILFFVVSAFKNNATVPVVQQSLGTQDPAQYMNPLPHTLMLTAIVVGVATVGVGMALLVVIYRRYKTLEEPLLIQRMHSANSNELGGVK